MLILCVCNCAVTFICNCRSQNRSSTTAKDVCVVFPGLAARQPQRRGIASFPKNGQDSSRIIKNYQWLLRITRNHQNIPGISRALLWITSCDTRASELLDLRNYDSEGSYSSFGRLLLWHQTRRALFQLCLQAIDAAANETRNILVDQLNDAKGLIAGKEFNWKQIDHFIKNHGLPYTSNQ